MKAPTRHQRLPGLPLRSLAALHFEVYPDEASITDDTKVISTSQVALPQDVTEVVYAVAGYETSAQNSTQVSLADDDVFGDDDGVSQLPTAPGTSARATRSP